MRSQAILQIKYESRIEKDALLSRIYALMDDIMSAQAFLAEFKDDTQTLIDQFKFFNVDGGRWSPANCHVILSNMRKSHWDCASRIPALLSLLSAVDAAVISFERSSKQRDNEIDKIQDVIDTDHNSSQHDGSA